MNRRTFLAAIPAVSTLAGCTHSGSTPDDRPATASPTASPTATRSPTAEPTTAEPTTARPTTREPFPVPDHPATADLATQPSRGAGPRDTPGLVVTFSDPSCPVCAWFAEETVSRIDAELVEPGKVTYVHRTIPVIHDWAEPCVQAQEATFARDEEAFWALTKFYYDQQRAFYDGADVLSETRSFLAENTALDADAVVSDAESKAYDDAVQTDLDASEKLDLSGTPTSFLFEEGEYVTKLVGGHSFTVVETALDL